MLPRRTLPRYCRRMKHTDLPHTHDDEDVDDDCLPCLAADEMQCVCRCGECCRSLIIEVLLEDGEVEPKIKERCEPLYAGPEMTASGQREQIGYLLNSNENGGSCAFFDRQTNLCTIWETR